MKIKEPVYTNTENMIIEVNKNTPNMVGQITSVLASYGINIHNMINKSKGDLAYNILDLDSSLNDEVLILLTKIHGITKVRYIPNG